MPLKRSSRSALASFDILNKPEPDGSAGTIGSETFMEHHCIRSTHFKLNVSMFTSCFEIMENILLTAMCTALSIVLKPTLDAVKKFYSEHCILINNISNT